MNTPDPYQPLPTADVPPPTITTPICPGSRLIPVTGMRPGSQIKIDQEGTILGTWTAPAADFAFTVARPLDASVMIDAQEQVCDRWIIGPKVPVAGSASSRPV